VLEAYTLEWEATSKGAQSDSVDAPYSIAQDDAFLYIVGEEYFGPSNTQWRIEKRRKDTGALEWVQISCVSNQHNHDQANSIAQDDSFLYIAGFWYNETAGGTQWRIEKRRKDTGALELSFDSDGYVTSDPSLRADSAYSIIADSSYLYIAGSSYDAQSYECWRIEKRHKDTGALESTFGLGGYVISDPSSRSDLIRSLAQDDSYLYAIGAECDPANWTWKWRIEKRRKSDGSILWAEQSNSSSSYDMPYAITQDSNYLYIAGYDYNGAIGREQWRIEKRNKTNGALLWAQTKDISHWVDEARSIAQDDSFLYIAGYALGVAPLDATNHWRIEKRRKDTGALEWEKIIEYTKYAMAYSIVANEDSIYIAGPDASETGHAKQHWRIEKRRKIPYIDIGLRVWDQDLTEAIKIAAWPLGEQANSPLRVAADMDDSGTPEIYGIALVDPDDAADSGVRIQIQGSSGPEIKALRKL